MPEDLAMDFDHWDAIDILQRKRKVRSILKKKINCDKFT